MTVSVHCAYDEMVPIGELRENPRNPNRHPDSQIELLAKIITETGWRAPITVSKRSGYIVRGHGRLMAARKAGLTECPVDWQDYESDEQELQDLIADNRIAELASIDGKVLGELMDELQEVGADLELAGYIEVPEDAEVGENPYTTEVNIPQYEITGDVPSIGELCDQSAAERLIERIDASGVTDEQKRFLKLAAYRHLRFDYRAIAEYYAEADEEMQRLMEDSALVIIDFDDAIAKGYATLSKKVADMRREDYEGDS